MGFFQILRSIEDFLYEVMTWLVFFPRTFWQIVRHPLKMADYSNIEQTESADQQYTDTLSPPLFLMLTILIVHGIEMSYGAAVLAPKGTLGKMLASSQETLLLFQSVTFSIFPLTFAVAMLKRSERALDRNTLRAPFFSQCYPAALFAFATSVSTLLLRAKSVNVQIAGLALIGLSVVWYVVIQTIWLKENLDVSRPQATWIASISFLKATFISALFAALVSG